MAELSKKELFNKAIALLARREYSANELAVKFRTQAEEAIVAEVISELQEMGYQSDQRFCESYIRMRLGQGHGEIRIRYDLKHKGIASDLITMSLEVLEIDWYEQAKEQYQRKYKAPVEEKDYKERAKRARFMAQRGFSPDQINYAASSFEIE